MRPRPRLVACGAALLTHADQASFGFRSVAFLLAHSHAHKVAAYLFTVLVIEPSDRGTATAAALDSSSPSLSCPSRSHGSLTRCVLCCCSILQDKAAGV
uniref:Uncharacterized protein n=1 Tax=Oryza barthii TaxID=65489 RepID=A0A0D3H0U0_9ORYZ